MTATTKELLFEVFQKNGWDKELKEQSENFYDEELAKQVYGEELVEDIAIKMLREGDSVDKIARITKLSIETVKKLQQSILVPSD